MKERQESVLPILPYTVCFPTGKVKASGVAEDREKKKGSFRFLTTAGKGGSLYLGDTFLGKVRVNEAASGFSLAENHLFSDAGDMTERLGNASLRLSVLAGCGWVDPRGSLTFRKGDLLQLDADPASPALLVYRDSGVVIGSGEVVTVGGFWGIRMQELCEQPRVSSGLTGYVETQVFLGSLELSVQDIPSLGEGTILQLDTTPDQALTLFSGGTPLAKGRLQVYGDRTSSFTQTFTRFTSASSPKLFFRITGGKPDSTGEEPTEGEAVPEGPGMMNVLRFLPSDRLLGFLKTIPMDLAAFVLKCLAGQNPEKAGSLFYRLLNGSDTGFPGYFIRCNPVQSAATAGPVLAGALLDLCDASEISVAEETETVAFSDPYNPLLEAAEAVLRLELRQRKEVLEQLEEEDPELYEEFRKYFLFIEDLVLLEDRAIQTLLREVDTTVLVRILVPSDDKVREKIFRNMSKRAADMIREEMDIRSEVPEDVYAEAAARILDILRRLIEGGDIVL